MFERSSSAKIIQESSKGSRRNASALDSVFLARAGFASLRSSERRRETHGRPRVRDNNFPTCRPALRCIFSWFLSSLPFVPWLSANPKGNVCAEKSTQKVSRRLKCPATSALSQLSSHSNRQLLNYSRCRSCVRLCVLIGQ